MSVDASKELQWLVDRVQVSDQLYRYLSCIDSYDFAGIRGTFADNAVAQYGIGDEPIVGGDEIVAWIKEMISGTAWQHHLVNVYHIDIQGDDAEALTYHTSRQVKKGDPDNSLLIAARYRDKLVRGADGQWKIVDKRMEVCWTEEVSFPQKGNVITDPSVF